MKSTRGCACNAQSLRRTLTRHLYVQKSERAKARERKAGVFSGRIETHQGKSQTPCSLDGQGKETEPWESIDKVIDRMVSESSGRNASEGKVASKCLAPGPSPRVTGEGSMARRKLTAATRHSGGVVATARRQGCTGQLEKPSSSHSETDGAESRITATPGNRRKTRGGGRAGSSGEAE